MMNGASLFKPNEILRKEWLACLACLDVLRTFLASREAQDMIAEPDGLCILITTYLLHQYLIAYSYPGNSFGFPSCNTGEA